MSATGNIGFVIADSTSLRLRIDWLICVFENVLDCEWKLGAQEWG